MPTPARGLPQKLEQLELALARAPAVLHRFWPISAPVQNQDLNKVAEISEFLVLRDVTCL